MVARTWGSTEAERAQAFPCDEHLPEYDDAYFRAIDVDAPPSVLFRWLCQMRAAPYSYDWIDNLGRRSPRELTPGLEQLAVGQRVMTIFDLVDFEPDRHLTIRMRGGRRLFGDAAISYVVGGVAPDRSRLVVKLLLRFGGGRALRPLARPLFPWLELFMMRKQLLTLRDLAERQATWIRTH